MGKAQVVILLVPTENFSFYLAGAGASCLLLGPPEFNWCFSLAPGLVSYFALRDLHRRTAESVTSRF